MTDFQPWSATSHSVWKLEDDLNNMLAEAFEKGWTYLVRVNGSYYEAIKGGTSSDAGTIAFGGADNAGTTDGTDASAVIQAALGALTAGRSYKEKVVCKGAFTLSTTVEIPSYTIFDAREAKFTLDTTLGAGNTQTLISTPEGSHIDIIGGHYDGSADTYDEDWAVRTDSPWDSHGILLGDTDNRATFAGVTNVKVIGVTVTNTVRSCITIEGDYDGTGDNVLIYGCNLSDSLSDHLIYAAGGKNITMAYNDLQGYCGGEVVALGTTGHILHDSEFVHNRIYNITANPNTYDISYLVNLRTNLCDNVTVAYNYFETDATSDDLVDAGIYCHSPHCHILYNTFMGAYLTGNNRAVIFVKSSDNRIIGNFILDHGGDVTHVNYGIRVDPDGEAAAITDIEIRGNRIINRTYTDYARGIFLYANDFDITDCTICDNWIDIKDRGIYLLCVAAEGNVKKVHVADNYVYSDDGYPIEGDMLQCSFANNRLTYDAFGIIEDAGADDNIYTNNNALMTIVGANSTCDLEAVSVEMDLSAAAEDFAVYYATTASQVVGYKVFWTEAAGDANTCDGRVGEIETDGTIDPDHYDTYTTAGSEAAGRTDSKVYADLTADDVTEGHLVTVGHTQKVGNGKVVVTVLINRMAKIGW